MQKIISTEHNDSDESAFWRRVKEHELYKKVRLAPNTLNFFERYALGDYVKVPVMIEDFLDNHRITPYSSLEFVCTEEFFSGVDDDDEHPAITGNNHLIDNYETSSITITDCT